MLNLKKKQIGTMEQICYFLNYEGNVGTQWKIVNWHFMSSHQSY